MDHAGVAKALPLVLADTSAVADGQRHQHAGLRMPCQHVLHTVAHRLADRCQSRFDIVGQPQTGATAHAAGSADALRE